MEPTPPQPSGGVSPLQSPPRGPTHTASQYDSLVPGHHHARRQQHAKISPRHLKLQSVTTTTALPLYATASLRDQIHGRFRHELFQFHQLLLDAVARCGSLQAHTRGKPDETQLTLEIHRSNVVLELLTSDHHAAVMREFFLQWQQIHEGTKVPPSADELELLCQVVDAIFRNVPTVLTENDLRNAKSVTRFVDTLKTLRELVLSLLYKTHGKRQRHDSEDENDDDDNGDDDGLEPSSGLFASTTALLTLLSGSKSAPSPSHNGHPSTPKRVPLYLYCQQLEREVETLKRRLRNVRRGSHGGNDDIGLLQEQTLSLLVQFWELPRTERLAFFCQVASQAKQEDCDAVLRVFLGKCDTNNLLSLWDALRVTPSVQNALAIRKHDEDVEAAAREAAEALAVANREADERRQKHGSGSSDEGSGSDSDPLEPRGRRGKRFAVAARGGHRPSQRQVDLRGLTEVFERNEDEEDGGDDGDGWGQGGKRRRRKLRLHDRGRTPEGHRSQHESGKHGDSKRRQHQSRDADPSRPDSSSRPPSKPQTPKPILDRLHSNLLELLKADDPNLDLSISDTAWKLVEVIDRAKRHDTIVPRGSPRKLSTLQQHPGVVPPQIAGSALQPIRRGANVDPLGSNLTLEQQYFVKIDQLQSLLSSLGGFSLDVMGPDTISSAYKRLPGLHRLFQVVQNKVYAAVGLDSARTPHSAAVTGSLTITPAAAAAEALAPPVWTDDQVMNSVEVMLSKLGKMVRSLAPIADVGSAGGAASSGQLAGTASSEILKLAEAMEEIASSGDGPGKSPARRHLSLDPARRMAMLGRLKSLAQSNQIESLTGLLTTTCDDIVALKAVTDHQQRQLQEFTSAMDNDILTDDIVAGSDDNGNEQHNGEVDEVLKLVKKAKIRRASAAKLAAASAISTTASRDDTTESEDDDQSLLMNPMTAPRYANRLDIPLTIKQATAQRGSKLFNAGILLRVVDQMYRENYETMVASLQYGSRRMEFSEFMYDWHIRKYGLKSLAQQHLLKLIQSLRKHERKVFQCHLCLRFLGIVSPLGFHEHKFVLGLLDKWSGGTFSGAAKHRVEFVPRQFKVRIAFAVTTIQEALSERFGVYFRTMDAVTSRIKSQAMRPEEEFIKESDLLTIAIDEWQAQRQRIEQILEAVYTAGDLNGDGSLEYDEFSAVMQHLSPALTDKFVQRVFTAAHDYLKPRRISFARFLDVVLLERVLNTSSSSKSRAFADRGSANTTPPVPASGAAHTSSATTTAALSGTGTRSSNEDEEIYQFNLLQETWEQDREIVAQALSLIPHQQTVASIQFRVTFLTQILSKRVDSKTAWMCHRQIMRDIRRYQNLNDDQIVAVKTKEESFKRAVMAIRNMQRLSLAFRRPTQEMKEQTGETGSPPKETQLTAPADSGSHATHEADMFHKQTSYVSVVEGALAAADSGTSSLVDIEALEDRIREKFLERADEESIEDFKTALQTIRRMSMQAFPPDLDLEQLRAAHNDAVSRGERGSMSLGEVLEEEEDDEEDEDDEDDEQGDAKENGD